MPKVFLRLVADATLVASILFVSAGTLAWWRAWVLLVVLLAARTVSAAIAYPVNPTLLQERAGLPLHVDQPSVDRLLLIGILVTGFLGLPAIAGLDRFHWHLLGRPAEPLGAVGLVLFTLGWGIKGLALRANPFATAVVRWQPERNHEVVETGPYAVVRHPFYAADPLIFLGLSLWLESYIAAVCALVPTGLMVMRLKLEEHLLRDALPGYRAYAQRVQHRLVPGLW
jgi:protein-S-isoprenylcysteine O-methyltransferase Ste14